MPLSFSTRADHKRESDDENESDKEDSQSKSSDKVELVWSENLTLQTDIPFDQPCGKARNLLPNFELFSLMNSIQ